MLPKVLIQEFFEAYSLRLKQANKAIDKKLDHATLHDFRVGFKKLRSFLRLLSVETGDPDKIEPPERLKKMNRTIGDVYDEQLCRERLSETIGRKGRFPGTLHIKYAGIKKRLLAVDDFEKIKEEISNELPAKLSNQSIRLFFNEKKERIGGIIRKRTYTDKELHSIRKLLKDMVNISKLWRDMNLASRYVFKGNRLNDAIAISDALGELNDTATALSIISPAVISVAPLNHQPDLIFARRQWLAGKRTLKKAVIGILSKTKFFQVRAQ